MGKSFKSLMKNEFLLPEVRSLYTSILILKKDLSTEQFTYYEDEEKMKWLLSVRNNFTHKLLDLSKYSEEPHELDGQTFYYYGAIKKTSSQIKNVFLEKNFNNNLIGLVHKGIVMIVRDSLDSISE